MERKTKQGVRDLNERGYNGHAAHGRSHRCLFGPAEIVAWRAGDWSFESIPVYGRRCLVCSEVRP